MPGSPIGHPSDGGGHAGVVAHGIETDGQSFVGHWISCDTCWHTTGCVGQISWTDGQWTTSDGRHASVVVGQRIWCDGHRVCTDGWHANVCVGQWKIGTDGGGQIGGTVGGGQQMKIVGPAVGHVNECVGHCGNCVNPHAKKSEAHGG
jgi:hypothetical protein